MLYFRSLLCFNLPARFEQLANNAFFDTQSKAKRQETLEFIYGLGNFLLVKLQFFIDN